MGRRTRRNKAEGIFSYWILERTGESKAAFSTMVPDLDEG